MPSSKERWDFRVAAETDETVRQAAAATDRTLTDFVLDAALLRAQRVLADRTGFSLTGDAWGRFVTVLDRPPRSNPGLGKLFAEPGVFTND